MFRVLRLRLRKLTSVHNVVNVAPHEESLEESVADDSRVESVLTEVPDESAQSELLVVVEMRVSL
jgi:hypothetical protein